MATGFYTAASGMLMQQRYLDTLGNNLSNIKTAGFKTERVVSNVFMQEMLNRIEGGKDNLIGKGAPVRIVQDVPTGFDDPSALEQTDRPFDMAINGIGFFNIKVTDADGNEEVYLTRNGNFDIDEEGYLILRGKGRVQGDQGDIQVGGSNFVVDGDGTIYNDKNRAVDKLYITAANENTLLTKARNGLYKADTAPAATPGSIAGTITYDTEAAGVTRVENPDVRQNWLETSNVDMNREMSMMMEVQRNFDSCKQVIKMIDSMDQKMVDICRPV